MKSLFEYLKTEFLKHGGLFVTGTDTGIGKTYFACALARGLKADGVDVGVFKPTQSGPADDAGLLRKAAGSGDDARLCNPYHFKASLAPALAARMEGIRVSRKKILACYRELSERHQGVVVEGAGGLLVPLAGSWMVADLAAELKLPLVIVARPGLGTVNHSLLTLSEVRRRGLKAACVVLNGLKKEGGEAEKTNPALLKSLTGTRVDGPLKWGFKSLTI